MKQNERDAIREWEEYKQNIANSTPVDVHMTHAEIEKKRIYLEAHPIEWIQYFFPKYASSPFAPFQKRAITRILANDEWYEVLSWSRELAKSTIAMFVIMYLALTKKKKNIVLFSATKDSAERLLKPYLANFEANGRLKAFYGDQQTVGSWTSSEFLCKCGASFIAIGAGNAPRGSRNENIRPDILCGDDFDTDEDCRNPDTLNKKWDWFEKALYPTRSISKPTLVLWAGNKIAKDCCITRAGKIADNWDIVNIRDKNEKSTWPEKNTEEFIDICLKKISTKSQQAEYYNNPVSVGTIFTKMAYGKIPNINKFKFLVIYGDPAPGENKTKKASFKGVFLCGKLNGKLYVIKGFLDHSLNSIFISYYISLLQFVADRVPVYCYMENNKLQDPFFRQVFKPLVKKAKDEENISLNIIPDEERKTDKAVRIEANLEPLNREGDLILNEDEQDNPHMQELASQFELFEMTLPYAADGPDCIEGANRILDHKQIALQPLIAIKTSFFTKRNKYRR